MARTTTTQATLRRDGSPVVAILTGSPSDLDIVTKARDALEELDIPCEVRVLSAHRTPHQTVEYVTGARDKGIEVFIACAGMAAHLAGVVAAHTTLPVIGVPLNSGKLGGLDALLSTVQMPPGVPVATVGIDGTKNAAHLAARILSLRHPEVGERIERYLEVERGKYFTTKVATAASEPKSKKSIAKTGKRK